MTKTELQTQWEARISEFRDSGLSQSAWCKTKKINLRTFNYWFLKSNKAVSQTIKPLNWVSIKTIEMNEAPESSTLSVKIGQAIVEVKSGFDKKLLLNIVEALSSLC